MDPSRPELRARRKVRKKRAEASADPARRPQDAQERLRGPDPLTGYVVSWDYQARGAERGGCGELTASTVCLHWGRSHACP